MSVISRTEFPISWLASNITGQVWPDPSSTASGHPGPKFRTFLLTETVHLSLTLDATVCMSRDLLMRETVETRN